MRRMLGFLFPGVGDHYPGMGASLYVDSPAFRDALDECAEEFAAHLPGTILDQLYPGGAARWVDDSVGGGGLDLSALVAAQQSARPLDRTIHAQPVVFSVCWALAAHFADHGLRPDAVTGYSLGEYTAACLAGVFSLRQAVGIVAQRALLIEQQPPGAMTVVLLGREELETHLGDGLWLAAEDSPSLCVVAGQGDAVAALEGRLTTAGVASRRVGAGRAFHTPMLRAAADGLGQFLRDQPLSPPKIPVVSSVSGQWLTEEEATSHLYWAEHMCHTVRFGQALETVWRLGPGTVVAEIGAGQSLSTLARAVTGAPAGAVTVGALPGPRQRGRSSQAVAATVASLRELLALAD